MLRIGGDAREFVVGLVPLHVSVHARWLEHVFDDFVKRVAAYQAFCCTWINEDAMHLLTFNEVEYVKGVLFAVVDEVQSVISGASSVGAA